VSQLAVPRKFHPIPIVAARHFLSHHALITFALESMIAGPVGRITSAIQVYASQPIGRPGISFRTALS
jgi:hypothetical protein